MTFSSCIVCLLHQLRNIIAVYIIQSNYIQYPHKLRHSRHQGENYFVVFGSYFCLDTGDNFTEIGYATLVQSQSKAQYL